MSQLDERTVTCPHCWEPHAVFLDASGGSSVYIEDCSVCCHPIEIVLDVSGDEIMSIDVRATQ